MANIKSVAVYCGSSSGDDPAFASDASRLGHLLAERGLTLVYGGGRAGLMGVVADAVLEAGGVVHGIITADLLRAEVGHLGLTTLDVVDTMHIRKARMAELADGFVALPGGFGTWEELTEMLTWTQLGIQSKPVALCNTKGYWNSLIEQRNASVAAGFIKAEHGALLRVGDTPADALAALLDPVPLPTPKWSDR
jgi:uncharacterized protein (TIGR00730 family)